MQESMNSIIQNIVDKYVYELNTTEIRAVIIQDIHNIVFDGSSNILIKDVTSGLDIDMHSFTFRIYVKNMMDEYELYAEIKTRPENI